MKNRLHKFARIGAAALVVVLVAAACSSDSDDSSSGGGNGDSSGLEEAKAAVEEFSAVPNWSPEGPAISGTEVLDGGTAWHIMIDASIPAFSSVNQGLETAFEQVGMTVQGCDAQFTPDGATSCINQAIAAGASAIVSNGVPTPFVEGTFEAVNDAGIPLVMGAAEWPEGTPPPDGVQFIQVNHTAEMEAISNWVIADSEGSADTLVIALTESGGGRTPIDEGFYGTMDERCPDCTNEEIEASYTNLDTLPSSLGAALNQYPDVTYVIPQYDGIVTPTLPGIQASGRADSLIGATGNFTTSGLQMVKDQEFLQAASGAANYINTWIEADQAIRMMLDLPALENPQAPVRLFTADNIDSIEITPEAEASGEWFGVPDVTAVYRAHWGLDG